MVEERVHGIAAEHRARHRLGGFKVGRPFDAKHFVRIEETRKLPMTVRMETTGTNDAGQHFVPMASRVALMIDDRAFFESHQMELQTPCIIGFSRMESEHGVPRQANGAGNSSGLARVVYRGKHSRASSRV